MSLFTSLCPLNAQQKSITDHKKRPITNPIHAETFLSHLEVDLIDVRNLKCSCDNKSHQWVLHITDHHTKYSWLYALHNKTVEEVLEKLEALFWVFGFPQTLHTDNGKEFRKKSRSEASSYQTDYNERMKKCRPKAKTLNIGDYVCIKTDKADKTPLHPNVLIGEILAFENDYAKVA